MLIEPILGIGQIEANHILHGNNEYVDIIVEPSYDILIAFYSPSGEYVGSISTTPDSVGWLDFKIRQKRIGGLDNFEFSISKNLKIPFYAGMEVRFNFAGYHWFTGELTYKPEYEQSSEKYTFEGLGYWNYLVNGNKTTVTYQNKSFDYIIKHFIENYIYDITPILYNPELIESPNITISHLEIEGKTPAKVLELLLDIANTDYKNVQYEMGVNKEKQFYFLRIDNDPYRGYFEGFQFQEPKSKINIKDIINRVDIYRTQQGSDQLELVGTVEDTTSQEKYGLKIRDLEISDYIDTASAQKVARGIIERLKDPKETIQLEDLLIETEPYPIGFYNINCQPKFHSQEISNFDELSEWSKYISNTIIAIDTEKVLSGRRAFKCTTKFGSQGEYIEIELDEIFNFPEDLRFYTASLQTGTLLKITAYDEDNNYIENNIIVNIVNDYIRYDFDIRNLQNLAKIKIEFLINTSGVIYMDSLDITSEGWIQKKLILNDITYQLDNNKLLAKAQYGEEIFDLISEIKKIKKKNDNIMDIIRRV